MLSLQGIVATLSAREVSPGHYLARCPNDAVPHPDAETLQIDAAESVEFLLLCPVCATGDSRISFRTLCRAISRREAR